MATLSTSAFLAKWLTKFASTGTGTITGAFMREFRQDLADSCMFLYDGVTHTSVDISGATFNLDFESKWEKVFTASATFATAKELLVINAITARRFSFVFEITDAAAALTLPSNFTMADALWNTSTNIWTPFDTGKYIMEGMFLSSEWKIKITGPYL